MRVPALIAVLLVILALASPAAAVDGGVPDAGRHPNVGLLGFDADGAGRAPANAFCTGSVVSHRAFLTAAHCITAMDATVQWVVTLEAGAPAAPVFVPGELWADFPMAITVPVSRPLATVVHPRFDPETLAHDLAVLVFAPGTFAVRPVALPRHRLLDRVLRHGRAVPSFSLVGYGADPEYAGGGVRYFLRGYRQTATAPFGALTRRQLVLQGAAASGRGGLCLGDSGGPQLLGNLAVSQLSAVGETCREIVAQRLDTPAERRFLARFFEAPPGPAHR